MAYRSPTDVNMSKGLPEFLGYINEVSNMWISNLILIGIFVIVLMGYYKAKDDFAGAFAVAGFGTFVVGLLFWLGGFVSGIAFAFTIGIMLIGVVVILIDTHQ